MRCIGALCCRGPNRAAGALTVKGEIMRRRIAVVGDALTSGGQILDYAQKTGFRFHGHKAALIGNEAFCTKCKSAGRIAKAGGPYRIHYHTVREVALDHDIVLCKCPTPPRIIATLAQESWCEDRNHNYVRGTVADNMGTDNANGHWISFSLKERGSCGGFRCVARFNDGSEEYGAFSADNSVRFERFDNDNACSHVELLLGDDAGVSGSVTESILSAIMR